MLKDTLFGATKLPLLNMGLDAYSLRHRAISDNIANAETFGYKRKKVIFESKLQEAIKFGHISRTKSGHLSVSSFGQNRFKAELEIDKTPSEINDMSNVDIEREMADLAKNTLQFNFASKMAKMYYDMLSESIRGV